LLEQIRETYRLSRKQKDIFWNIYVARPIAAVLLQVIAPTPLTPNQVTFIALFMAVGAAAVLALWTSYTGLVAGALLLELSYIFDCVDGQLARLQKRSTPVGAHLDFLMDELKAFLYVSALALRLWLGSGRVLYVVVGLLGLAVVAAAISLTTFMRRPEYVATAPAAGQSPSDGGARAASRLGRALSRAEAAGRFIVHYPSYFLYLALLDLPQVFFFVYLGANALYLCRSLLQIMLRLGRPHRPPPSPLEEQRP
jgi:phosphatidylglycerophosphate synthase